MYNYATEKPKLFTDNGQVLFLEIRDRAHRLVAEAGAVRMDKAIGGSTGDSWEMIACVDRMVELGELAEVIIRGEVAGQHRIFVVGLSPAG